MDTVPNGGMMSKLKENTYERLTGIIFGSRMKEIEMCMPDFACGGCSYPKLADMTDEEMLKECEYEDYDDEVDGKFFDQVKAELFINRIRSENEDS